MKKVNKCEIEVDLSLPLSFTEGKEVSFTLRTKSVLRGFYITLRGPRVFAPIVCKDTLRSQSEGHLFTFGEGIVTYVILHCKMTAM